MQKNIEQLTNKAQTYTQELLDDVFQHTHAHQAVVVYDTNCVLATILTSAYKQNLKDATFIDFNTSKPQDILDLFATLEAFDLVILIQSTNFRLDAFRIRVELFKRKIKVIEHPHLSRMYDTQTQTYIEALHYDKQNIPAVGKALKIKMDRAQHIAIESGEGVLHFPVGVEDTKLNIGDYSSMPNIGGQFPIGEVFTESKELRAVHGRVDIFAFADLTYRVNRPTKSITLIVKEGIVVDCENSTPAFDATLALIREGEEVVWVRELGFGLNRGFTKENIVNDIGSYERMCGVHLSLGRKHGMYAKPGFKRGDGKFHIDVFVDTHMVYLDDACIFEKEAWQLDTKC